MSEHDVPAAPDSGDDPMRCICNKGPDTDGPEQTCPQHGARRYFVEMWAEARAEVERLRAEDERWDEAYLALDAEAAKALRQRDAYRRSARSLQRRVRELQRQVDEVLHPADVTLNRLAQRFYEAARLPMRMTDKPLVVAGLRAVFAALSGGEASDDADPRGQSHGGDTPACGHPNHGASDHDCAPFSPDPEKGQPR